MAYIISFILLAFLFLALHYFTELARMHKITITTVLFVVIYSAIAYNTYKSEHSAKLRQVVTKYQQGKTLKCKGVDVNSSYYSLSIGTYTFIGKENTPHYGEMISADECE